MSDATLPEALREHYRVVRDLGEGGMGRVFLAEHLRDGSLASVKLLFSGDDAEGRTLFEREALALMELDHPGLPRLRRFGFTEEGAPYLALDYIPGFPLDQLPAGTDPLEALLQVAEALDAMHRSGLVHRDVKPANILCDGGGRAWLIDLGIAWSPDMDTDGRERSVLGTLQYLSPARLRGEHAQPADDWHAWGATLYELHEGTPPFTEEELYEAARSRGAPEPHFSVLPTGGRRARLLTALLTGAEEAPGSAREIRRFLDGEDRPPPARGIDRSAPTALQSQTGAVLAAPVVAQATRRLDITTTVEPLTSTPPVRLEGPETPVQRGALLLLGGLVVAIWGVALIYPWGSASAPPTPPSPSALPAASPSPPAPPPSPSPEPSPSPSPSPSPTPSPSQSSSPSPSPVPTTTPPATRTVVPTNAPTPAATSVYRLPPAAPRDRIWVAAPHHPVPREATLQEVRGSFALSLPEDASQRSAALRNLRAAAGADVVVSSLPGPLVGVWKGEPPRLDTIVFVGADHEVTDVGLDPSGNFLVAAGWRPGVSDPSFDAAFLQLWDLTVLRLLRYRELDSRPARIASPGTGQLVVEEPGRGPTLYRLDDLVGNPDPSFRRLPRYGGPGLDGAATVTPLGPRLPLYVDAAAGYHLPPDSPEAVARDEDLQPVVLVARGSQAQGRRVWVGAPAQGAPALLRPGLLVVPDPETLFLHGLSYPRSP
jgi:serine/threonine-protein kinase